jgi:putative transposase
MDVFNRNSHHIYYIHYHFVWIPKYRHKIFQEPYRTDLKQIIRQAAYNYNMEVTELEIPPDHIHMMIKTLPKFSPSTIMQTIKSISAIQFFKKHPAIKSKYFWGGHLWTESYYVETVGRKKEDELRQYVQNQLKVLDQIENQLTLDYNTSAEAEG